MNILVLGSGAWGTALSLLLVNNGHHVTLWSHRADRAEQMAQTRRNPALDGVELPEALSVTADVSATAEADLIVVVTPSYALRETIRKTAPFIRPGTVIVSATKGIERDTELRMSEIIQSIVGQDCPVAALSGPSHAEEVSRQMPTGCVVACEDKKVAELIQQTFMSNVFRVYINNDIIGVEYCGALKNVIALGCGILKGLEQGDNARALFMTRAMAEIAVLNQKAGGQLATCSGLAGMGDMIVTCCSGHSRNRRAGILIGSGVPVDEALAQVNAIVEGYYAAASAEILRRNYSVEMPICHSIYDILYCGASPAETFMAMMERDGKSEFDFSWQLP